MCSVILKKSLLAFAVLVEMKPWKQFLLYRVSVVCSFRPFASCWVSFVLLFMPSFQALSSFHGVFHLSLSFCITDILKKFNPNVYGFSKGKGGRPNGFNMAVSGAKAAWVPAHTYPPTCYLVLTHTELPNSSVWLLSCHLPLLWGLITDVEKNAAAGIGYTYNQSD